MALVVLTLPLLAFVAVTIKLDSPGPVFTSQSWIGPHGRLFRLLSFRTTWHEGSLGQSWKPFRRETRVGPFLRYTRIADLPRLINVVRGEMRLFGPGQERSVFAD